MNQLKLELAIFKGKKSMEYENIIYSNCAFIYLIVDGVNLIKKTDDRKGVIVWNEIKKTTKNSGQYLILTCVCGIANDAGFEFVDVTRNENSVKWKFNDESNWNWEFPKEAYDEEINTIEQEINKLDINFTLEPKHVIFPE